MVGPINSDRFELLWVSEKLNPLLWVLSYYIGNKEDAELINTYHLYCIIIQQIYSRDIQLSTKSFFVRQEQGQ